MSDIGSGFADVIRLLAPPDGPLALLSITAGIVAAGVVAFLSRKPSWRKYLEPQWILVVTLLAIFIYLSLRESHVYTLLVTDDSAKYVIGGYDLRPEVVVYLEKQPGATISDALAAFGGWEDPETVWTRESVLAARRHLGVSYFFVVFGIANLIVRVRDVLNLLKSFFKKSQ